MKQADQMLPNPIHIETAQKTAHKRATTIMSYDYLLTKYNQSVHLIYSINE